MWMAHIRCRAHMRYQMICMRRLHSIPFSDQERKWREGELEKARRKAQAEEEVRAVRDEQLRQRREAAARAVERERAHWERGREQWLRENRAEEAEGEGRRKVRKEGTGTAFVPG